MHTLRQMSKQPIASSLSLSYSNPHPLLVQTSYKWMQRKAPTPRLVFYAHAHPYTCPPLGPGSTNCGVLTKPSFPNKSLFEHNTFLLCELYMTAVTSMLWKQHWIMTRPSDSQSLKDWSSRPLRKSWPSCRLRYKTLECKAMLRGLTSPMSANTQSTAITVHSFAILVISR